MRQLRVMAGDDDVMARNFEQKRMDDAVDRENPRGPDQRRDRRDPEAAQDSGSDHKQDDDEGSRDASLRILPQQFVIEGWPGSAGRCQPVAGFAHALGGSPPVARR